MARISNSSLTTFWECPEEFNLEFVQGWQKEKSYLNFGHRFHELLMHHYCPDCPLPDTTLDELTEAEVQAMFEAYKAAYPTENFEVVDCERKFEIGFGQEDIPVNDTSPTTYQHTYIGRIDMLVRDKETHALQVFETKTEARNSKRNLPKAWMARSQGSLYTWAATQVYGEAIDSIILNVCTKGSEKGRVGPSFRRDTLQRTPEQVGQAIASLVHIADQIDRLKDAKGYPRNTNSCISEFGWECDFYGNCHFGIPPENSGLVQVEPYSYLTL